MPAGTTPARSARRLPGAVAALLAFGLCLLGLAVPTIASADTRPPTGTPATVSADALGTVQVNGVVWSMVTVGNTVYATGSFTNARPSGAAAGTSTTPRANLVAFNLTTGAMTTFNHTLNGQGRTIVASPDQTRIYVGGDFTTVDGVAHNHIAAFTVSTGALVSGFTANANNSVLTMVATNSTVYAGGSFTSAGGQARTRLAAFSATTGAVTAWAPTANNNVRGIALNPSQTRVIFDGDFDTVSGTTSHALASVDLNGGSVSTWNFGITNGTRQSGMWNLKSDGTNLYATAWGFTEGNIEGIVAINPDTLGLVWMNDCHGDNYDAYVTAGVLYASGHTHDCATSSSFPDQRPRTWKRVIAMTTSVTGTLKATTDVPRYASWTGNPHPSILNWFPTVPAGTFTGQDQGAWSVTGSGKYLVYGGEFTSINGGAQQGLVRFATSDVAPDKRGPELNAAAQRPNATSTAAGRVTVSWPASWDMDNSTLTYNVYRTGTTAPIYTTTFDSAWWNEPPLHYTDTLPAGSTASYRVTVADPFGNTVSSSTSNTVTVASAGSSYAAAVLADSPAQYWRLGETSGTTGYDYQGTVNLTEQAGITHAATGAVAGDGAINDSGAATAMAVTGTRLTTPWLAFSIESWVNTTSGGIVLQYGDTATGANTNRDRVLYVDSAGRLEFALARRAGRTMTLATVSSPGAVNDGQWHHVAVTLDATGTTLYLDGGAVASNPALTTADTNSNNAYYAQIGGGTATATALPNAPASNSFVGSIDEVAIYNTALTAAQVANHKTAGAGGTVNTAPTAAFTATPTNLSVAVDGSASSDAEGPVASYAWNWGDGSAVETHAAPTATANHAYASAGTYNVTLTVTDGGGATNSVVHPVTVTAPGGNTAPTASFSASGTGLAVSVDGSTSSDAEGPVASYAWNWGDGSAVETHAAPTATANHTYASAGTYTITLTVTDGGGLTGQTTKTVTLTAPVSNAFASDAFNRTVTGGLGVADIGGSWTASAGASRQSVTPGTAQLQLLSANSNTGSYLSVSQTSADITTSFSLSSAPTGTGTYLYVSGRRVSTGNEYRPRIRVDSSGAVYLALSKLVGGTETFPGGEVLVSGLTWAPGTTINTRVQVFGTGTTTVRAKAWTGGTEPTAWQFATTDADAALQAAGGVGLTAHIPTGASATTVSITAFSAKPVA